MSIKCPWRASEGGVCMFLFFMLEITILWRNNEVKTHSHTSGIPNHLSQPSQPAISSQQPVYRSEREERPQGKDTLPLLRLILYLSVAYFKLCFRILNTDMPKLKRRMVQSRRAWTLGRERKENIAAECENEDAGLPPPPPNTPPSTILPPPVPGYYV